MHEREREIEKKKKKEKKTKTTNMKKQNFFNDQDISRQILNLTNHQSHTHTHTVKAVAVILQFTNLLNKS